MKREIASQFSELDHIIETFGQNLRDQFEADGLAKLKALEKRITDAENMLARKPASLNLEQVIHKSRDAELTLPAPLTFGALDAQLRKMGFGIRDNRANGGGYWVLDDGNRFEPFAKLLRARGVSCEFRASRRRYSGPSYWIDTSGSLPE